MFGHYNKEYDSEPVKYCSCCYSLKIRYEDSIDADCCADCGCSDILEAPIDEWEKKYEARYGKKFVNKEEDIHKNYVFTIPVSKIKTLIFNSKRWKWVIRQLYPHFPEGFSKADSIILLFDKLIKDNRLSDLRMLLINNKI